MKTSTSIYLCCNVVYHFLGGQVALVANKQLVYIVASITIDFFEPLFDIVKRVLVRAIIDNNNAMGASVIAGRDGSKALLSGRVPLKPSFNRLPHTNIHLLTICNFIVLPSKSIVRIF